MKFLLITVLLGVSIASCYSSTVEEVKAKISGVAKRVLNPIPLPGRVEHKVSYKPTGSLVGLSGKLTLDHGSLYNLSTIALDGEITILDDGTLKIPLTFSYLNYVFDYDVAILIILTNNGKLSGKIYDFHPVIIVREENGVFELVRVLNFTMGPVPITFSDTHLLFIHDALFNFLKRTFASIVEDQIRDYYGQYVLGEIVKLFN